MQFEIAAFRVRKQTMRWQINIAIGFKFLVNRVELRSTLVPSASVTARRSLATKKMGSFIIFKAKDTSEEN